MDEKKLDNIIRRLLEDDQQRLVLRLTDITQLCLKAAEVFISQSVLLELNAPIIICGDMWGNYDDLLRVFTRGGFPPKSDYLFLGDYIDETQSFRALCLLLAYKIKYPNSLFLLRGECNEAERINNLCHFECPNAELLNSVKQCFSCMPVAAIIKKKIFCVHGGLSSHLHDLEQIKTIERPAKIRVPGLLHDLISSKADPAIKGWGKKVGEITTFGPDKVSKFLNRFNLDLICVGHRVVEDGYEFFVDRQLVTLFSARNLDHWGYPTVNKKFLKNMMGFGAIVSIDDNFMFTFLILISPFTFHLQQQGLLTGKANEILTLKKIGRKQNIEAKVVFDEFKSGKLDYDSATTCNPVLDDSVEEDIELAPQASEPKIDDYDLLKQELEDALLKIQQLSNNTLESCSSIFLILSFRKQLKTSIFR